MKNRAIRSKLKSRSGGVLAGAASTVLLSSFSMLMLVSALLGIPGAFTGEQASSSAATGVASTTTLESATTKDASSESSKGTSPTSDDATASSEGSEATTTVEAASQDVSSEAAQNSDGQPTEAPVAAQKDATQPTTLEKKLKSVDGRTYTVRVTYGPEVNIPEGTELQVVELNQIPADWDDAQRRANEYKNRPYATEALLSADDMAKNTAELSRVLEIGEDDRILWNKTFDVSLVADEQTVTPNAEVQVDIETDAILAAESDALEAALLKGDGSRRLQVTNATGTKDGEAQKTADELTSRVAFATAELGRVGIAEVAQRKFGWVMHGDEISVYGARSVKTDPYEVPLDLEYVDGLRLIEVFGVEADPTHPFGTTLWVESKSAQDAQPSFDGVLGYKFVDGRAERVFGLEGTNGLAPFSAADLTALVWDSGMRHTVLDAGDVMVAGEMPVGTTADAQDVTGECADARSLVQSDEDEQARTLAAYNVSLSVDGTEWNPGADPVRVKLSDDAIDTTSGEKLYNVVRVGEGGATPVTAKVEDGAALFDMGEAGSYAVVERVVVEREYTASDGKTYKITVGYDTASGFPKNAVLVVNEVAPGDEGYDTYLEGAASELGTNVADVKYAKELDISIVDPETGQEFQPTKDVDVSIELLDRQSAEGTQLGVVHFGDDGKAEAVEAKAEGNTVEFSASGFSVYVVVQITKEQVLTASDGKEYKITVTYDSDAGIPEEAKLSVSELDTEGAEYQKYVEKAAEKLDAKVDDFGFAHVFDIALVNRETGEHYKPTKALKVSVKLLDEGMDENSSVNVVHFGDETEVLENSVKGDTVEFETDGFSVYVLTDSIHHYSYRFFVPTDATQEMYKEYTVWTDHGDSTFTQILKPGESLIVPELPAASFETTTFSGWYEEETPSSDATHPSTFKNAAFDFKRDVPDTFDENKEIRLYARYASYAYVIFHEQQQGSEWPITETRRGELVNGSTSVRIDDVTVTYDDPNEQQNTTPKMMFKGWTKNQQHAIDNNTSSLENNITENSGPVSIPISEKTDLYPVFVPIHWLTFNSGPSGSGATYIPPKFYYQGEGEDEFRIPTRKGFNFEGWYTEQDGGELVVDASGQLVLNHGIGSFSVSNGELMISSDAALYGHWSAKNDIKYTVLYWQQNANDDGYSLESFETINNGTAGATTNVTAANDKYPFFHLSEDQDKATDGNQADIVQQEINGSGGTTVNVYYDRNVYTVRFYAGFENSGTYYVSNITNTNNYDQFFTNSRISLGSTKPAEWNSYQTLQNPTTPTNGNGYTVYYFDLTAKYGADISNRWPALLPTETSSNVFIGWIAQKDSYYWNRTGTQSSVKGVYPYMDIKIIGTGSSANNYSNAPTSDQGIAQVFLCRYSSGRNYVYDLYMWNPSIGEYPSVPDAEYLIHSSGDPEHATNISFNGYEEPERKAIDKQGNAKDLNQLTWSNGANAYNIELTPEAAQEYGVENVTGIRLRYRYMPKQYGLSFLYNSENLGISVGEHIPEFYYTARLKTAAKTYIEAAEEDAKSKAPAGYDFSGWYADTDGTTRVFFDRASYDAYTPGENQSKILYETMPDHALTLYPGYNAKWCLIKIDPNGGNLAPGQSTFFWETYGGDPIEEYTTTTRNFTESLTGTWYYASRNREFYGLTDEWNSIEGNLFDKDDVPIVTRGAYYTQDINDPAADLSVRYEESPNAFKYAGWYEVKDDGREELYSFGQPVYHDTTLRLHWKQMGTYCLRYDPGDGTLDGHDSNEQTFLFLDDSEYTDHSNIVVTRTAQAPEGYNFIGWRVRGADDSVYYPGSSIEFQSKYAFTEIINENGVETEKKVLILDAVYTQVKTARIIYDANGGALSSDADAGYPVDADGNQVSSPVPQVTPDTGAGTLTIENLVNNSGIKLSSGEGFTMENAELVGWNTSRNGDPATHFDLGQNYYVDTAEPITLYAEWKVRVYFDKNNGSADWGGDWTTAVDTNGNQIYFYDDDSHCYYTTVLVNNPVAEPEFIPTTTDPDKTFYYWESARYGDPTSRDPYDFSAPVTSEITLFGKWDLLVEVPIHAVDTSEETIVRMDEGWLVSGVGTKTRVGSDTHVNLRNAAEAAIYANQVPAGYDFAFACVSRSDSSVSESNIIRDVYWNSSARHVWVTYADGSGGPMPENDDLYLVYFRNPKARDIMYRVMGSDGALTAVTVNASAPTTASLGEYDMQANISSPLAWANNSNYRYYAYAIGSATATSDAGLQLVTSPSPSDDDSDRPSLSVKNTWRGFQYTLNGINWVSCGYDSALYVVYFESKPTIVTLNQETLGFEADMSEAFEYQVVITETTRTYSRTDTFTRSRQKPYTYTLYSTGTESETGSPTNVSVSNYTIELSNGDSETIALFNSRTEEPDESYVSSGNRFSREFTITAKTQTITITQTPKDGFTVDHRDGNDVENVPENKTYTYTTTEDSTNQSVTFTNKRTPVSVEVHVAVVEGDTFLLRDFMRKTDAADYTFTLTMDADAQTLSGTAPVNPLKDNFAKIYGFAGVIYGSTQTDDNDALITEQGANISSIAYQKRTGSDTIYDLTLSNGAALGSNQLYYVYYKMPRLYYVKEGVNGALEHMTSILRNGESVLLGGRTVTPTETLPVSTSPLVISQSASNGYRVPPDLDGYEEYSLQYKSLAAGPSGTTNTSTMDYVNSAKTLQLKVTDCQVKYSLDGTTWESFTGEPAVYAIYKEKGHALTITKAVDSTCSGWPENATFTVTVSSPMITAGSYPISGYTDENGDAVETISPTVKGNGATEAGTITFSIKAGESVTVDSLQRGYYTVSETIPDTGSAKYFTVGSAKVGVTDQTLYANQLTITNEGKSATLTRFVLDNDMTAELTNRFDALCKVVHSDVEHLFPTLNEALNYITENMVDTSTNTATGSIEMLKDYDIPNTDTLTVNNVEVTCDITLTTAHSGTCKYNGNGNATIKRNFNGGSLFTVGTSATTENSSLTLTNLTLDGNKAAFSNNSSSGGLINVTGGALNIKDGAVLKDSSTTSNKGHSGAVHMGGGQLTISGGTITNCEAAGASSNGGAIYLNGGKMTMTGGSITNCSASQWGGAICVGSNGTLKMSGGRITGNSSAKGALDCVSTNYSKIYFSGTPYVYDNYHNGDTSDPRNVGLLVDNNDRIYAAGLDDEAKIGVWTKHNDDIESKHGKAGKDFASFTRLDHLECFINDLDPTLYGVWSNEGANRVAWCKSPGTKLTIRKSWEYDAGVTDEQKLTPSITVTAYGDGEQMESATLSSAPWEKTYDVSAWNSAGNHLVSHTVEEAKPVDNSGANGEWVPQYNNTIEVASPQGTIKRGVATHVENQYSDWTPVPEEDTDLVCIHAMTGGSSNFPSSLGVTFLFKDESTGLHYRSSVKFFEEKINKLDQKNGDYYFPIRVPKGADLSQLKVLENVQLKPRADKPAIQWFWKNDNGIFKPVPYDSKSSDYYYPVEIYDSESLKQPAYITQYTENQDLFPTNGNFAFTYLEFVDYNASGAAEFEGATMLSVFGSKQVDIINTYTLPPMVPLIVQKIWDNDQNWTKPLFTKQKQPVKFTVYGKTSDTATPVQLVSVDQDAVIVDTLTEDDQADINGTTVSWAKRIWVPQYAEHGSDFTSFVVKEFNQDGGEELYVYQLDGTQATAHTVGGWKTVYGYDNAGGGSVPSGTESGYTAVTGKFTRWLTFKPKTDTGDATVYKIALKYTDLGDNNKQYKVTINLSSAQRLRDQRYTVQLRLPNSNIDSLLQYDKLYINDTEQSFDDYLYNGREGLSVGVTDPQLSGILSGAEYQPYLTSLATTIIEGKTGSAGSTGTVVPGTVGLLTIKNSFFPFICKIEQGDDEHVFDSVQHAVDYLQTHNMTTDTIKMLVDYTMDPEDDVVTIPSGYNVTLTTASTEEEDKAANGGIAKWTYHYSGSGAATITRGSYSGSSSSDKSLFSVSSGTLTLTDLTLDGGNGNTTPLSCTGNGGLVKVTSGTLNIQDGAKLQNSTAEKGGAVYADDGTVNLSGTAEITGNQTSTTTVQNGGGVYMASGSIHVGDSVKISGNTTIETNTKSNLQLASAESCLVVDANLTGDANIGISNNAAPEAEQWKQIGTKDPTATQNLDKITSDIADLYAVAFGNVKVVWNFEPVCKLTDAENNLLFQSANLEPAVYATLQAGFNAAEQKLFDKDGHEIPYAASSTTNAAVKLKVLKDLTLDAGVTIEAARSITFTTAENGTDATPPLAADIYTFSTSRTTDKNRAQLIKGQSAASMFTASKAKQFIMSDLILDGNSLDPGDHKYDGGGINVGSTCAEATLYNVDFLNFIVRGNPDTSGNNGKKGGGAYFDCIATVSKGQFVSCKADSNGGGVYFNKRGTVNGVAFDDCVAGFTLSSENKATRGCSGGGAYFNAAGTANCVTVKNCHADADKGGGLYFYGQNSAVGSSYSYTDDSGTEQTVNKSSSFENCTAGRGGGVHFYEKNGKVEGKEGYPVKFTGCQSKISSEYGGGIATYTNASNFKVIWAEFNNCIATNQGGGGGIGLKADSTVSHVTITKCSAGKGGGIYSNGDLTMVATDVTGNSLTNATAENAAGVYLETTKKLILGEGGSTAETSTVYNNHTNNGITASNLRLSESNNKNTDAALYVKNTLAESCKIRVTNAKYIYVQFGSAAESCKTQAPLKVYSDEALKTINAAKNIASDDEKLIARIDPRTSENPLADKIYWWGQPVCKITDANDNLLTRVNGEPAVYGTLKLAFTDYVNQNAFESGSEAPAKIKMLVAEYQLEEFGTGNEGGKEIPNTQFELTSASKTDTDKFPGVFDENDLTTRSVIVRGNGVYTHTMFRLSQSSQKITIKNLVIDGSNYNPAEHLASSMTGKDGWLFRVEGISQLILDDGAELRNCYSSEGGAVFCQSGGKLTMKGTSEIHDCHAKNGGGVFAKGGGNASFTMEGSAKIYNCDATGKGGGVSIGDSDTAASFTMKDSASIKGCTAQIGAGIYVAQGNGLLKLSGNLDFGGTGTDADQNLVATTTVTLPGSTAQTVPAGNFVKMVDDDTFRYTTDDDQKPKNGKKSYLTIPAEEKYLVRQDIFIAGFDSTNADSVYVTGKLTGDPGTIWVWAEKPMHYVVDKQFAQFSGDGISLSAADKDASMKVFRNARADVETKNPLTSEELAYLFGVAGTENYINWGAMVDGSQKVILKKIGTSGQPLSGAHMTVHRVADPTDPGYTWINPNDKTQTELLADKESQSSGVFWIGVMPYGTYYLEEKIAPTADNNGTWYYLIVDEAGVFVGGGTNDRGSKNIQTIVDAAEAKNAELAAAKQAAANP